MYILGISAFYHDAAAALLKDGQLVAAAEEERFSRKKHDYNFPINAIQFCLKQGGISSRDLDYVVFYEKPFLKFERILLTTLQTFPKSWGLFRESMLTWLLDKLWVKGLIKDKLDIPADRILFSEHHLSHAASAFLCSPFPEAAILTVDGVGEWATATMGVARGNDIRQLHEIRFPHSLGLLYSAFTAFLGFEVNEGEYKVMGMAPYGQPRYMDKVYELIKVAEDGSFWMDMRWFTYHHSTRKAIGKKFEQLFGTPRDPKAKETIDPYYADVAASIQKVTEEIMLKLARQAQRETGLDRLCMAGGVALNSVANGRILRETGIKELFIQPSAGDGGAAVGAALYAYHTLLGKPRQFVMEHAYWGAEHSTSDTAQFLRDNNVAHERFEDDEKLLDRVTDMLVQGKVVGWMQGRFEFGPRALGNRSILADPRRAEMKDIVNRKIKFREPFRPFAPSVIAEEAETFFDLPNAASHYPARYMLLVVPVKEGKKDVLPAITHVDGTARLQTVHKDTNPRYHRLIQKFGQATGVPVVLNTSFNLRGEPIVNTPQNAMSTFTRSEMDALVIDRVLITKGK
ncbi:MAG: carbamoyltransferase [Dehalococcoidia bacterium]|nr:carbamoyltransferase [Dehalococcoidia bacterium]